MTSVTTCQGHNYTARTSKRKASHRLIHHFPPPPPFPPSPPFASRQLTRVRGCASGSSVPDCFFLLSLRAPPSHHVRSRAVTDRGHGTSNSWSFPRNSSLPLPPRCDIRMTTNHQGGILPIRSRGRDGRALVFSLSNPRASTGSSTPTLRRRARNSVFRFRQDEEQAAVLFWPVHKRNRELFLRDRTELPPAAGSPTAKDYEMIFFPRNRKKLWRETRSGRKVSTKNHQQAVHTGFQPFGGSPRTNSQQSGC